MTALVIYAVLWLTIALSLLLGPVFIPALGRLTIYKTSISFGWVALAMSGFYVFRWILAYQRRLYRQAMKQKRQQIKDETEKEITNPEFAFNEDKTTVEPAVQKEQEPSSSEKRIKHPEFVFDESEDDTHIDDDDKTREQDPDKNGKNGEPT